MVGHIRFINRYLCNFQTVLLGLPMWVDLIVLCLICIFNVKFIVIEGQGEGVRREQGGFGELSRAMQAARERYSEKQVDGHDLIGFWMVVV
jgi:uncharacterized membrane protein